MFLNIFFILTLIFDKNLIFGNNIVTKELNTKLKKDEVTKFFKEPVIFNKYLEMVEATDIIFDPKIEDYSSVNFPIKITYNNYPKINFFPYKLPKTNVVQIWDIKNNKFIGNINCIHLCLDVIISIEGEENVKIIFYLEIKRKKFYVPDQILDTVVNDLRNIIKKLI